MAQLKSSKVTGDLNVTGEANVGTKITVNGEEVWDTGNLLDIGTTAATARTALGLGAGATRWPTFAEVTGKPATYAPSGHTHPTSQVTGLDTTLAGKADKTTQVIAGTGLTGGGTLAANRTLNVSYGTAAGTAAQGNDSRLSNSREWTAGTISQAEAEAGADTTRRAWTSQRVRQAANSSIAAKSGSVNGIASLDGNGKIPLSQLSDSIIGQVEYMGLWAASTNTPTLPTTPVEKGHYYVVSASGTQFGLSFEVGDWVISNGASWDKVDNTDAVSSVNGRTGNVTGLAESNDTRFTNSREWTASVVSQTEAQAGTETTARKWTAQRVAQAISALGLKIGTTASTAKAGNWMPTWADVTGKPTTFTPSAHTHSLSQITDAGSVASLSTNASTVNFLRGDGTWVTPPNTNTTYSEISTEEIDAGTASTSRTITGRRMKYALDKKTDTSTQVIAGTGLTGGGTLAANRTLNVSYGTAAGTAAQGNDSRINNGQAAFNRLNIGATAATARTALQLGTAATKNIGTTVDTVMAGDDTRVVANTSKLTGIATGATKNATDADLRARSSHTGTQAISTIAGLQAGLDAKVNIVAGKDLSTEDYSTADKTKLVGIAVEATKNRADSENADKVHTHTVAQVTGLGDALDNKVDTSNIAQTTGQSTTNLMSQKATTDAINTAVVENGDSSGPRPIKDHGNVAVGVGVSQTVLCDVQESDFHIMSISASGTTGTLTIDFSNMPDTLGKHFSWHVRLQRGARKTVEFAQTINWVGGVAPTFGSYTNSQDLMLFYKVDSETIRGMVIDAW